MKHNLTYLGSHVEFKYSINFPNKQLTMRSHRDLYNHYSYIDLPSSVPELAPIENVRLIRLQPYDHFFVSKPDQTNFFSFDEESEAYMLIVNRKKTNFRKNVVYFLNSNASLLAFNPNEKRCVNFVWIMSECPLNEINSTAGGLSTNEKRTFIQLY